ncbi:hypothetical protein BJ982_003076 [Sphaerisporangium siamense]|uniref:Uncharacterized protein n=1 Tax=Sphaerisporangium siamense TaxID=795645 RepID=A0A7W7D7A1_9ACTN|nr:hypothetical protein [Sphaerisporangium siamense]
MRRRIATALLAALISVGAATVIAGVTAAPAAADQAHCC